MLRYHWPRAAAPPERERLEPGITPRAGPALPAALRTSAPRSSPQLRTRTVPPSEPARETGAGQAAAEHGLLGSKTKVSRTQHRPLPAPQKWGGTSGATWRRGSASSSCSCAAGACGTWWWRLALASPSIRRTLSATPTSVSAAAPQPPGPGGLGGSRKLPGPWGVRAAARLSPPGSRVPRGAQWGQRCGRRVTPQSGDLAFQERLWLRCCRRRLGW